MSDLTDQPLSPLPGEAGIPDLASAPRTPVSRKALLAVALLVLSMIAVCAFSIQRFAAGGQKTVDPAAARSADRPAVTSEGHRLDLSLRPEPRAETASAPTPTYIPALIATADDAADPIAVRRTGPGNKTPSPDDAPVLLTSNLAGPSPHSPDPEHDDPLAATTRNLQGYQHQLQGLLDTMKSGAGLTASPLVGGPLQGVQASPGAATARVEASLLEHRSLTLPKGTVFTCALKTRIVSTTSGLVGCQVQRNLYGDDGRVLLVERGAHLDGEYRVASLQPGSVRIPVMWTRLRTPNGVTVNLNSPATGPLGESGIDGHVDQRWGERLGAAMLLSLIDDSVKLVIQNQANAQTTGPGTVVLPSTEANTSKLAEKVLDSTINIPPLIYRNQGGIVGVYTAHDLDFSPVYALRPSESTTTSTTTAEAP